MEYRALRCPNCDKLWEEEDIREGHLRKFCPRCKWFFEFEWRDGKRQLLDRIPKRLSTIAS